MWIKRDFEQYIQSLGGLPIKILKGPRQVGKTALLTHTRMGMVVYFDDSATRRFAAENPRAFLDQYQGPLILDEATLVPDLFLELKRRVDEHRRDKAKGLAPEYWITGSNQTLLQKQVRESLAGRASYFDLNTLSIHELGQFDPANFYFRGGWPQLNIGEDLDPSRYLNDLISTFIEKDIVAAAGIERKASFSKALGLIAGRVGQLFNASDIAVNCGVSVTTIQSWVALLEENGILRVLYPYASNVNTRLTKAPKVFFEDVSIATRLQGWSEFKPLMVSPYLGNLFENCVLSEICRFFTNRGDKPKVEYLRTKEKTEIDFLVTLSNQRHLAIEAKITPVSLGRDAEKLLQSVKQELNIVESWVVSPTQLESRLSNAKNVGIENLWEEIERLEARA